MSWFRMRGRGGMAARFARGCKLSDFDARIVGIVDVESAFAVAPNSRASNLLHSILAELFCGGLDFRHAERKMILRTKRFVVGVGGNVQHVLNPIIALGNLQLVPVEPVVLEPAPPVQPEAKPSHSQTVLSGH